MELTKKEQELVTKKDFRKSIKQLQDNWTKIPGSYVGEKCHKINPTKSFFAGGCYIREIFTPAGQTLITAIHKKDHPFFVMSGKLSIATEEGVLDIEAPYHGITKAGTQRVIQIHEDVTFVTVHATEKTTEEEVIEDVIAKDFNDPAIALE
tara:strand:- start:507 stop:959 length:453 start_codon:yes stop_codon:yes gene_type:complete